MENYSTLSERVILPSRGLIYPESWDVKDGIYIKPMRVKDLKGLLNSPNNYNIDFLIKNCLNTNNDKINIKELISFDKNALIIRIACCSGISPFKSTYKCFNEECKNQIEILWDLDLLDEQNTKYLKGDEKYPFTITLPESKIKVQIKYLTDYDLEYIYSKLKLNLENYYFYDANTNIDFAIQSIYKVEDKEIKDKKLKEDFYYSLTAYDSYYFEEFYKTISIGPLLEQEIECDKCKRRYKIRYPIDIRLFCNNPNTNEGIELNNRSYKAILKEQLDLAEYGHISISETDNLFIFEKDAYYKVLLEKLEQKQKDIEKSKGNALYG